MATLRQRMGARLLHWYPLVSGCGTVANHSMIQSLVGASDELVWARTAVGQLRCSLGDYVGRAAYYLGDLDPKVSWIVRRLVNPQNVVLDIGANVGLVTLLLARQVGPHGRVHAFEPNPAVAMLLQHTLEENRLQQVMLHRCGLGSKAGRAMLSVPELNAGAASFVRISEGAPKVEVPVRTLASIAAEHQLQNIDFIKMDVEGCETDVLRGGMEVLRDIRPKAILFELNETGVDPKRSELIHLLRQSGYGFFSIPRCLFRVRLHRFDPAVDPSPESNDFLAVPMEAYEKTARLVRAAN